MAASELGFVDTPAPKAIEKRRFKLKLTGRARPTEVDSGEEDQ